MAASKEKKVAGKVNANAEEREKALATAIEQLEKRYGSGTVMRLGENVSMNVEHISTGSLSLDLALGIGGLPKGRITEIYGPESSGKTTIALHAIAEMQKAGGRAAFIDVEHALDPIYAESLGVDINQLLVSQPDTGEQAMEITEALVMSGAIDIVVVDSVAALVPKAEIEGDMGDSHVGLQARLMSQSLRKLNGCISKYNCIAIFINQLRDKIGVIYGSSETTTGGRALKFFASVRIDIRKVDTLKSGTELIGSHTRAKVVKNKVAPPFKSAEFDIMYGKGISKSGELIDLGVEYKILRRSGAFYYYGEQKLGQGRDNAKQTMENDPQLAAEVEAKIFEAVRLAQEELAAKRQAPKAGEPTVDVPDEELPEVPKKHISIDVAVDD